MGLREQHCQPIHDQPPLAGDAIDARMSELKLDWQVDRNHGTMTYDFQFKNFHETMAFVNAVAWVAHQEDHHPDMQLGYKHCQVTFSTHSIGGLSDNDFICAAKIEALIE